MNEVEKVKLGIYFVDIFTSPPQDIFERELDLNYYWNNEPSRIVIKEEYFNQIKDNIIISPFSLPMISQPLKWSESSFGGYLSNKKNKTDIITGSKMHAHKMENKNKLYEAINYLNSIEFKINSKFLDYLNNEGNYLLKNNLGIDKNLQRDMTIKIAEAFNNYNKPIYIPCSADWRGRIYTDSFFIDYQGSDLSLALLNFWKGEKLSEKGLNYLYIYGANNHNQDNISKKSFEKRIQWTKDNYDKIINLDRNLIETAENPFVFTSFCLEMRDLDRNKDNFIYIPIFLDATVNGMQHIAALLQDFELGTEVNLNSFDEKMDPKDLYTKLLDLSIRLLMIMVEKMKTILI